jgi:hypothetical protein
MIIEAPDHNAEIDFPDDTPQEEMARALRTKFPPMRRASDQAGTPRIVMLSRDGQVIIENGRIIKQETEE